MQVENPIPFAGSPLIRALSTGYLHARYFWLLLMPLHLSADWSFNCIPLVESVVDWRNLATLGLYCYFGYTAWSAQPLAILQQLWAVVKAAAGQPPQPASSRRSKAQPPTSTPSAPATQQPVGPAAAASLGRCRWRLMVLVGLVIAPFFPASNVLFYVGTFIGERLLYCPSIGFCLLAADLLAAALLPRGAARGLVQQQQELSQGSSSSSRGAEQSVGGTTAPAGGVSGQALAGAQQLQDSKATGQKHQQPQDSSPAGGKQPQDSSSSSWRFVLVCVLLLGAYAGRTLLRNQDWWDDERLFLSALRVCPDSAKVQQNNGVLQRRFRNWAAAMEHFRCGCFG